MGKYGYFVYFNIAQATDSGVISDLVPFTFYYKIGVVVESWNCLQPFSSHHWFSLGTVLFFIINHSRVIRSNVLNGQLNHLGKMKMQVDGSSKSAPDYERS